MNGKVVRVRELIIRRDLAVEPYAEDYVEGTLFVLGKLRPWEDFCTEYLAYNDGDILLIDIEGRLDDY